MCPMRKKVEEGWEHWEVGLVSGAEELLEAVVKPEDEEEVRRG